MAAKHHLDDLKEFHPTTDNVRERGNQLHEWIWARGEKRWKEQEEIWAFTCALICSAMILIPFLPAIISAAKRLFEP